jgi:hypothetical protein
MNSTRRTRFAPEPYSSVVFAMPSLPSDKTQAILSAN